MKDLKLTDDNRIELSNGDFSTVEDIERIKQHIAKTGLKILPQDWVLDYRKGIDYIYGLRANPARLKAQIKSAIQEVWGVDRLLKYEFDDSGEVWKVKGIVLSNGRQLPFEGAAYAV